MGICASKLPHLEKPGIFSICPPFTTRRWSGFVTLTETFEDFNNRKT
jgi:hypothetical protein